MSANAPQGERTIKDKIFDKHGKIPLETLQKLLINGDRDQVDECLSQHGWKGEPVASPLIITEASTGKILGSKWSIRGPLSQAVIKCSVSKFNITQHISYSFISVYLAGWPQGYKYPPGFPRF